MPLTRKQKWRIDKVQSEKNVRANKAASKVELQLDEDEIAKIVAELVAEVGLPRAVLTKEPVELSGGMRKRAGLARLCGG